MNKKFVMIAAISVICLATVAARFSASAMQVSSNQLLQEARNHNYIIMQSNITVTKIDKTAVASQFGISAENLGEKTENYYRDSNKNIYMIDDQNRLTTFWQNWTNEKSNKGGKVSSLEKIDSLTILKNAIKDTVPNSNDFRVVYNTFKLGGYNLLLERTVGEDISDSISARINPDGSIDSINVNYCNVDADHPITQVHKQQLDAQVQKYIEQKKKSDANISEDKILSRSYNRDGNQIVATYTIRYTYPSGDQEAYDAETKFFKISA